MQKRAEMLLQTWCDTLLSYQVKTATPYTNNALLCPACHVIHGRIADLCCPLTVLWAKTRKEAYLEQADKLIDWSEYNLKNERGLWRNDVGNLWFGTSAFSALSLGEAMYRFGDILPEKYKNKWMPIFLRIANVFTTMDRPDFVPVSNCNCGIATLLAMAWKLTDDVFYYEKSNYWVGKVLACFDENGLLYGEGYPMDANACEKVLTLYETCTHDGLLAMPMAHEVGEPTCLHHTFAHAKALAALVCAENVTETPKQPLPCEVTRGIKSYQNGKLLLLSNDSFRATISAIQASYLPEDTANGGGSLNLLYHKQYGVVCAATSAYYIPSELLNQQYRLMFKETPALPSKPE